VAAIASGDLELIRCYAEGIDVHWKTTVGTLRMSQNTELIQEGWNTVAGHYGTPATSIHDMLNKLEAMGPDAAIAQWKAWKERRKQSKGINFGFLYSMGAKKFTEYAKLNYDWSVSLHEAEEIREAFFATYSQLPSWHVRQRQLVQIDGHVRNLAGRLRRLPGIWSSDREVKAESERLAINSPIQGFIGDLKVMGMVAVHEEFPSDQVMVKGEVHDSVLMWVKDECLDAVLPKVKQLMEHPPLLDQLNIKLSVPIVVDIEVGRWGAGKPYKPS
jgi:DNA polymerase I-like protein with 3'-5' exonuclease and polymerase domains